uniref:Uncharacterized protein n=1 Tax=Schizaphis graminum TaxID=13262 RepID=A0A2S2P948_SCHGA
MLKKVAIKGSNKRNHEVLFTGRAARDGHLSGSTVVKRQKSMARDDRRDESGDNIFCPSALKVGMAARPIIHADHATCKAFGDEVNRREIIRVRTCMLIKTKHVFNGFGQ